MKLKLQNKGKGPIIAKCYELWVDDDVAYFIDWDDRLDNWSEFEDVTIDTESNQPNIYRCMEYELDIQVFWKSPKGNLWYDQYSLSEYGSRRDVLEDLSLENKIQSIQILDLDKMEGVEVVE